MVKKARLADELLSTAEVHVSAMLPSETKDNNDTSAWRIAALREAEGIDEVKVEECGDCWKVRCGPFVLRSASDSQEGPILPIALVYSFACLSAANREDPEVKLDEVEACAAFLEGVKSSRADASAIEIIDGALAEVDAMLGDSQPLSDNHSAVHESAPHALTADECARVIAAAEAHTAQLGVRWQRTRHAAHATTDIAVKSVPALKDWLSDLVAARLLPQMATKFEVRSALWIIH